MIEYIKSRYSREQANQIPPVSVADPDPRSGIRCFFDPGWKKNRDPGSGMNIPDLIFEMQIQIPDPGFGILPTLDPGYGIGMEKVGSGIRSIASYSLGKLFQTTSIPNVF